MDEPNPPPEPTGAAKETSSVAEEPAVARGSGHIHQMSPPPERTETSVVELLPEAKTERIVSMRRELADLQRHLIEAQQRVATELQGRAEDAERLETLETFVQEHELHSQKKATRVVELETEIAGLRSQLATATATSEEHRRETASRDAQLEETRRQHREELEARSSSLNEAKTLLETRATELATRTTERETEQVLRAQLERDLEDQRKQHRDVTDQLELQFTSLRDAKALMTTYNAELAATTSERDALKSELERARHELDAGRTKARDVANQLARLGQDLGDGGVITQAGSEPKPATTSVKRQQPPPVPQSPGVARAAPTAPVPIETILEMTEEPKTSRVASALFMLGGVIVGCAVTIVIMKWSSTPDDAGAPAAPIAAPVERSQVHGEDVRPSALEQPIPASETVNAQPKTASIPAVAAPAGTTPTDGIIVLPASAAGHRIYVDGRVVEVKSSRASVACGTHEVRIGSSGTARSLEIACGGETELPEEPRER